MPPMTLSDDPDVPVVYRLGAVLSLRDSLLEEASRSLSGRMVDLDLYSDFVTDITDMLGGPERVSRSAVFESCLELVGRQADPAAIREACWRLAGCSDTLRRGLPVPKWQNCPTEEWVPFAISHMDVYLTRKGRLGYIVEFVALAGQCASKTCSTFVSRDFCFYLGSRMGFGSRRSRLYRMEEPEELCLMRFYGFVSKDACIDDKRGFRFDEVRFPPSCISHNRKLIRLRDPATRHDTKACPKGFTHPCYRCYMGHGRGQEVGCHLAVRQYTMRLACCADCKTEKYLTLDRVSSRFLCRSCLLRSYRRLRRNSP